MVQSNTPRDRFFHTYIFITDAIGWCQSFWTILVLIDIGAFEPFTFVYFLSYSIHTGIALYHLAPDYFLNDRMPHPKIPSIITYVVQVVLGLFHLIIVSLVTIAVMTVWYMNLFLLIIFLVATIGQLVQIVFVCLLIHSTRKGDTRFSSDNVDGEYQITSYDQL